MLGIPGAPGRPAGRLQGQWSFILAFFIVFFVVLCWFPMARWCGIHRQLKAKAFPHHVIPTRGGQGPNLRPKKVR